MSIFSSLNAEQLTKDAAKNIVEPILASASTDEDKALQVVEALSDNWLAGIHQEITAIRQTLSTLADGYTVTIHITKEQKQ